MRQAAANGQSGDGAGRVGARSTAGSAEASCSSRRPAAPSATCKDALRQAEEIAREQQQIAEGVKGLDSRGRRRGRSASSS